MKTNELVQITGAREPNHGLSNLWQKLLARLLKRACAVGLVLTATAGLATNLAAADIKPQPANKKAFPSTLTGRIVFVDKVLRALAVEVKGQILQVNAPPHVRITRAGKIVSLDQLAAGQQVTLTFRESLQGRLEVVSVSIEASAVAAEAAGAVKAPRDRFASANATEAFPSSPNPANLGGQIRSPNQ